METADSVEKALERLMPRGMSERATGALESMIDELAGEAPARPDWARIGIWSTGAVAAVLAVFFGLHGRAPAPARSGGLALERPQVELVAVVEGVVAVDPVEQLVASADGGLHREWHMQVVTEERFHDEETGHEIRVVHPRDEVLMVPVTSF